MARICKVLVVEDDDAVRALLGDVFADEGYHFTLVASGREMRAALDDDDYDVAVIDVLLRSAEDGFALAEAARAQGCGVILATGDHRHRERLAESDFPYLMKPFRMQEMVALVDRVLKDLAVQCVRRSRRDGSQFAARQ